MQHGAGGNDTGGQIAPQRHHQLARQRHNGNTPDAPLDVAHPLAEPARQGTVGLMNRPQPRQFDGELAGTPVAGFADALFAASLTTVVRGAGETKVAADLATVDEVAIEYFVDQCLAADRADAFKIDELHDLGLRRVSLCDTEFGAALGLKRVKLLGDQAQPLALAHNLFLKSRRQRSSVAGSRVGKAFDERPIERLDIADALSVQQSLDAIDVSRALLDETLALTGTALAVLILNRRHVDHAADPRLAPQIGKERPHQLLQIDPVGLGAPCATVHLDAGRVNLMVDDTLSRQPSMQPMAVKACLIAG